MLIYFLLPTLLLVSRLDSFIAVYTFPIKECLLLPLFTLYLTLFHSPFFYSPILVGVLVKSPVQNKRYSGRKRITGWRKDRCLWDSLTVIINVGEIVAGNVGDVTEIPLLPKIVVISPPCSPSAQTS